MPATEPPSTTPEVATVAISGGGIVGLTLALALHKHVGVTAEIYERAESFQPDVGAGMGLYPNGLRVLRDIDPALLQELRSAGIPYETRQWERADGSLVMRAEEEVLCRGEEDLTSLGIRRWKLQKILLDAVRARGIPVFFGKETSQVEIQRDDGLTKIVFTDGTERLTHVLFAADGGKSTVRKICAPQSHLEYTGVTCLMGISETDEASTGIRFPSSCTSQCHAAFFRTSERELCFQFHFPIKASETDHDSWGNLSKEISDRQCHALAEMLREEDWHDEYVKPLEEGVQKAVKIGFCLLKPRLKQWVFGRAVLLGDAAHPPVPYTGQGAQQGLEDAGSIALLLKHFCLDTDGQFQLNDERFEKAMQVYQRLRIPHTTKVAEASKEMGHMNQKRAENEKFGAVAEEMIQRQVFYHETLPAMFPGATNNYKDEVERAVR